LNNNKYTQRTRKIVLKSLSAKDIMLT